MDKKSAFTYLKKIKMYLVFFCVLSFFNCKETKEGDTSIIRLETNNKDVVSFESTNKIDDLSIVLENQPDIPILGDWSSDGDTITFIPVLPFTVGQTYNIKNKGDAIYVFDIEPQAITTTTELLAIYPTTDSVPENLLKMYLVFSKPMQELGNSLDYITIYDNTLNQEVTVFLELQSELWNKDHTTLTLWLDPGRVKTDLIPNKRLGLPIEEGHNYTITINANWKDFQGQPIDSTCTKSLRVGNRDSEKPKTTDWTLKPPKKDTKEPLRIDFNEAMDYFLVMDSFTILDSEKNNIAGTFSLVNKERELHFYPNQTWKSGTYNMFVENHLEDLAGNNLNHLFDTDLKGNDSKVQNTNSTYMSFIIQ